MVGRILPFRSASVKSSENEAEKSLTSFTYSQFILLDGIKTFNDPKSTFDDPKS